MNYSRFGIVLLAVILIGGCAGYRERKKICNGMLQTGLLAESFQSVWGNPTRTKVISGDEIMSAGWDRGSGGVYKGKAHFQVWSYENLGVDLFFNTGRRSTLAGWSTKKTVQEISTLAPDNCTPESIQ